MSEKKQEPSKLVVISGESGAGKTTVIEALLKLDHQSLDLMRVVTSTTRAKRPGEVHGEHYFFYELDKFMQMQAAGNFVETVACSPTRLYGTEKASLQAVLDSGKMPVLNLELQGTQFVRKAYPDALILFLMAQSESELRGRLIERGEPDLEERIVQSRQQKLDWITACNMAIVSPNGGIGQTISQITCILENYRSGKFPIFSAGDAQ